mgnify:FL=1
MCIRDRCNNANNEICPIWPNNNKIIHWDIEDPVSKFKNSDENQINEIINVTYDKINEKINIWLNNEN